MHKNPFARGQIIAVTATAQGGGYSNASASINTSTGVGAVIEPVIQNGGGVYPGGVTGYVILDAGQNYQNGDTITVHGDGSGATATLTIGPQSRFYPGVPSYFQQRRVYASSMNDPDFYWMSQVGSYTNMDSRIPTIDSDAITGNAVDATGQRHQAFVQMPGGLVTLTGLGGMAVGWGEARHSIRSRSPRQVNKRSRKHSMAVRLTSRQSRLIMILSMVQAKGSIYRDLRLISSSRIYIQAKT